MKITKKEEAELCEWGVIFYKMGWDACFDFIKKGSKIARDMKMESVSKEMTKIRRIMDEMEK